MTDRVLHDTTPDGPLPRQNQEARVMLVGTPMLDMQQQGAQEKRRPQLDKGLGYGASGGEEMADAPDITDGHEPGDGQEGNRDGTMPAPADDSGNVKPDESGFGLGSDQRRSKARDD